MKKIFFILILFVIFCSLNVSAWVSVNPSSSITPSSSIGRNLFANSSSVTIVTSLDLISPKNGTYIDKDAVPLNYSYSNADLIQYRLDSETNVTVTSPTFLSMKEGGHILYLYAFKNSELKQTKNISFSIIHEKIKIKQSEWIKADKGNTTNFTLFSYEELQNLSDVVLEAKNKGKIKFNQNINLTDDFEYEDKELDLEAGINISFNRIEINSTALPNFNKSATLSLYDLTFTNPRILKNGIVCPSSICTKAFYSEGILEFNVTSFSTYSSEETSLETTPTSPSEGGSSGAGCNYNWICSDWYPNPCPQEGIQQRVCVNKGTCLGTKEMPITNQTCTPKTIMPSEPLFDIFVTVPFQYKWITSEQAFGFDIELMNMGNSSTIDIFLKYWITDENNSLILEKQETRAISKEDEFRIRTVLPEKLDIGLYKVYAQINYDTNKIATAEDSFEIVKSPINVIINKGVFFLPFILIIISVIIGFSLIKRKKKHSKERKVKVKEEKILSYKEKTKEIISKEYLDLTNKKSLDKKDKYLDLTGRKPKLRN